MSEALGLIETRGYIPSIEAADTMVKSANVRIEGYEKTGSGYITVMIRGDVSAVKAAIDAGIEAAAKHGEVTSHYVIPRLDAEMERMVPKIHR